jgi:hypothetical protein
MSVRSAAQISSPRNGLSICRIIVFGIIGRAMPAGIGLRIRFTCRVSRRTPTRITQPRSHLQPAGKGIEKLIPQIDDCRPSPDQDGIAAGPCTHRRSHIEVDLAQFMFFHGGYFWQSCHPAAWRCSPQSFAPHQEQGDVRNQYPSHDRCQAHG